MSFISSVPKKIVSSSSWATIFMTLRVHPCAGSASAGPAPSTAAKTHANPTIASPLIVRIFAPQERGGQEDYRRKTHCARQPGPQQCRGATLVSAEAYEFLWAFRFSDRVTVTTQSIWRVLTADRIAVTSEGHQQQFGLPAPVDAAKRAFVSDRRPSASRRPANSGPWRKVDPAPIGRSRRPTRPRRGRRRPHRLAGAWGKRGR